MLDLFTLRRIQSVMNGYIHEKVPAPLRTMVKLTYEMNDNELILTEERPAEERYQWDKMHIARFYWEENQWKVYARDEQSSWNGMKLDCSGVRESNTNKESTIQSTRTKTRMSIYEK